MFLIYLAKNGLNEGIKHVFGMEAIYFFTLHNFTSSEELFLPHSKFKGCTLYCTKFAS